MTIRTQRRLYLLTATVMCGGIAWVWLQGLSRPQDESSTYALTNTVDDREPAKLQASTTTTQSTDQNIRQLPGVLERRLRAPLYDPPPPPPPQIKPPPPLRLKLLGTIIEAENSEAILMTTAGNVEMHRVGAVVDDAALESIAEGSVTVRYHDQVLTLTP